MWTCGSIYPPFCRDVHVTNIGQSVPSCSRRRTWVIKGTITLYRPTRGHRTLKPKRSVSSPWVSDQWSSISSAILATWKIQPIKSEVWTKMQTNRTNGQNNISSQSDELVRLERRRRSTQLPSPSHISYRRSSRSCLMTDDDYRLLC